MRYSNLPQTKEMKLNREAKPRRMVIEEEETSQQMRVNEVADTKASVRYNGIERESAEQVTFSSYGQRMTMERISPHLCCRHGRQCGSKINTL